MSADPRSALARISRENVILPRAEPDPQHIDRGGMNAHWAPGWVSGDGLLDAGFWEFEGAMEGGPIDGFEMILVVLDGSGEILDEDGTTALTFEAGDIVVYDAPLPRKILRSPGFRGVYVQRFRSEAAKNLIRTG